MALNGLKMALKWLKTHEFGSKPDQLPENRKNRQVWSEITGKHGKLCFWDAANQERIKVKLC